MSNNGKIKYTIDAEDRVSDVLTRVKGSMSTLKTSVQGTWSAFRSGGVSGAVEHFKQLKINGLASTGMFKMLVGAINPVTLALAVVTIGVKLLSAAWRQIKASIGDAIAFQKHTFDLKALVGSYGEARRVMLQLTEGKLAVDHIFGTDAVVKAYRNLHTYSNGALASAAAVNVLANRANHTGKSLEEMTETAGKAWQFITAGQGLGMSKETLISGMRIDASALADIEKMQKAGASAGDVWMQLWHEIEKTNNSIAQSEGSIDRFDKRIKDAKGSISTAFGEMFTPLVSQVKYIEVFWLEAFAKMIRSSKEAKDELADMKLAADKEEAAKLEQKWGEARDRQSGRREDERLNAMPSWQLGQEAEKAAKENRVSDWEKLTELREKKLAEEQKARADELDGIQKEAAANRQAQGKAEADSIKEAERLANAQQEAAKSAVDALAGRKDELALAGMSASDRAAEFERRAAAKTAEAAGIRGGRTDDTLSAVDLAAASKAELEALNLKEMAKGERASIAEQTAREAAADASKKLSIKDAADAARKELAGMSGSSTSGIDVAGRTEWMRNVRTPDEEIAENTKRIAELLEIIKKDGGIA